MAAWPAWVAPAQTPPPPASTPTREIRIGETIEATLRPNETSGAYYDDYRLVLSDGQAVQIDLESTEFDTLLELRRAGASEPLASNDDRGDASLNSKLIFNAVPGGEFIVRAGRFYSGSGSYTLTVARVPDAPRPLALVPGRTGGDFDEHSAVLPSDFGSTYRYALYEFRGVPGHRIQIDMTSVPLNSRLELLAPDGAVLVIDDNGGAQRNARLLAILRTDAMYTVRASAPATQSGHFDIDFHQGPPAPVAPPVPLRRGVPINGRFDFDSAAEPASASSSEFQYFYRDFTLRVTANEVLTIDLESNSLDPYLEVGVMSPLGFAIVARDDDGGDGVNSRLVLRPAVSGPLNVRARSYRSQVGCFTLRVTQGEVPLATPGAAATPVTAPGATASQDCPATPTAAPAVTAPAPPAPAPAVR